MRLYTGRVSHKQQKKIKRYWVDDEATYFSGSENLTIKLRSLKIATFFFLLADKGFERQQKKFFFYYYFDRIKTNNDRIKIDILF